MAHSARASLIAAGALLCSCSEQAPEQQPVDMAPGQYRITLSPDKFAEYFEAIVDPDQTVCINADPQYVPSKLARVFMEPDDGRWSAEFERAGNRLTGSTYCPSPRRDLRGGLVLNFDGAIGSEQLSGDLSFRLNVDPASVSEEDRRDIGRLGTVEGHLKARRAGDC